MSTPGQPVGYMERTRLYYRALGYKADYQWAHHTDAPFARLPKPLSECRIALLTTASPLDVFAPTHNDGTQFGSRSFHNTCQRVALLSRNRSTKSGSTDSSPAVALVMIGNRLMMNATRTTL